MKLIKDESGLSVVVGTLLLIIVVVASVSALALMVSEAQKKEMERNSLRSAVESENLKITSLALNDTDSDGYWNTMKITVVNLNTEEARIVGININDRNAENYTDGVREYNFQNQFPVPEGGSRQILLNLTSNFTPQLNISRNDAMRVILFTSLANKFERVFLPPVPIIKVGVVSEQIGTDFHDVLALDGSDSIDREGTIIKYQWQVSNSTIILGNLSGQKARMNFNLTNTGKFWVELNVTDSNGILGSAIWDSP
ncbi:MAG: hypothetical protein KKI06_03005 [Euryarchaeota archaeon]|nr:hypothetical protein [Euryarchaeota archaeon]MBU4223398.1 hypothetical protein [Euryarchaeota archaeon]MCG2738219.1 hypothetical protein [Candidatus Methanoperedenaceae archaeon]